jgi:hypothetical protein
VHHWYYSRCATDIFESRCGPGNICSHFFACFLFVLFLVFVSFSLLFFFPKRRKVSVVGEEVEKRSESRGGGGEETEEDV